MSMNIEEAQVVDPILSKVALGFSNNELVGENLFPTVDIESYRQTLLKMDKSAFVTGSFKRAPGSDVQEVDYGHGSEKISLLQESVFVKIPKEILKATKSVPNLDHQTNAVMMTMDRLRLSQEIDRAEIAQNPSGYSANHKVTLTSVDSFAVSTTKTNDIIKPLKQAVRRTIGRRPNTIVLPSEVFDSLDGNNHINDKNKHTSSDSVTTDMLARYWGIENVVVANSLSAAHADVEEMDDVWESIVMAYVPPKGQRFASKPAYGYTYSWKGHPLVHEFKFNEDSQSWRALLEWEQRTYQHGLGAGALIINPNAQ